ncbi:MAG TPA: histidine kinase N-terminal 7TM domain-containing protein [Anaerolineales bacterium]|nr:histidine kinase N-terminal 7TM domain-containing protein [Anaerolineales bacterium]
MQWLNNPFVFPILIAGLLSVVNALVVAQRRRVTGSMPLFGILLAIAWWSFTYVFELASSQQNWELLWSKMEYIGIVTVPVFFLLFALEYSGYRSRIQRWITLLWIIPALTLFLVWTNDFHGLIWSHISQQMIGGYYLLALQHGIAFWIWAAYSYLCLLAGLIILIVKAVSSPPEFRLQAGIIATGAILSAVGNLLYLFKLLPIQNLDTTPISFAITTLIYSIGLFRFGILDIMRIASETVLESMDEVVIVLNNQSYIVFINNVFEYYFGMDPKSLIGKFSDEAFGAWPGLKEVAAQSSNKRDEIELNLPNFGLVFFDITVSKIRGANKREVGRTIVLDDVTERRHAERRIAGESIGGTAEIPLILVYRAGDERIIEVNRTFLLQLGYERRDVVGRSLLEAGIWDAYQRAEFLRALYREGALKDHILQFTGQGNKLIAYKSFVDQNEIQGERYVVVMAQELDQK